MYGAECPLPTLLNPLAMPGCSKIKSQWDRCGVYYINPIDRRVRYPPSLPAGLRTEAFGLRCERVGCCRKSCITSRSVRSLLALKIGAVTGCTCF
jgi:hypothetical protein